YFLFRDSAIAPEPLPILLLPGISPFRTLHHDPREQEFRPRPSIKWQPGPLTPGHRLLAADAFRGAWFTTGEGKALLVRIIKQFESAGINCRIAPTEDGHSLTLVLPAATLVLRSGFPTEAPVWMGARQSRDHEPWSPSTEIV